METEKRYYLLKKKLTKVNSIDGTVFSALVSRHNAPRKILNIDSV